MNNASLAAAAAALSSASAGDAAAATPSPAGDATACDGEGGRLKKLGCCDAAGADDIGGGADDEALVVTEA